ncbi:T9SS type A sorting domain-containing protein [Chryseobacterium sp. MEBOG07]|uniref:T9SS type A sorting domain-containing protein n=1 Tax=Chryseobacterium sp. MEBOG07 TaxID=2879939 RepID=UPI001F2A0E42|nr:T9SS type A sorting domain-containing protein [Chryseobacterium sp. MEBOG07]UKB77271.1 T9SS type A sorting domain-containing protein [Chryseobacterium sp. MEBOG07]
MKKLLLIGLLAINTLAFGQATTTIPTFTVGGASFAVLHNSGALQGTLTSVSLNATLTAQTGTTWANDLAIIVMPTSALAGTPLLQVGGTSNFGAAVSAEWANGGASAPGTALTGSYTLTTPINFTANPLYSVHIGNGYANTNPPTNSGTWTNITATLAGVSVSALGTKEITEKSNVGVTVYPNPVTDVINVTSKDAKINLVSVIDMTGKSIKTVLSSDKKNDASVNVSELTAGNYILIIDTEKGRFNKKFIKK